MPASTFARRAVLRLPAAVVLLIASVAAADPPEFETDVRPLLDKHCLRCHGPEKRKGGLWFDAKAGAIRKGDSGEPAIVPGRASESRLIELVASDDPDERMPPEGDRLAPAEIDLLRRWIDGGAEWPEEAGAAPVRSGEMVVTADDREQWSFRPLRSAAPPNVHDAARARTPVDAFVLASLEGAGLSPAAEADRRTLIRRLFFDLIGLPPAPEQIDAFAADESPDAYERLMDRLLADPRYGERWGRHWLDVARYADSNGQESDQDRPTAWRYRDFVLRALNDDMPFDRFVRWQLAGDEIAPDDPLAIAATGFVVAGPNTILDVPMEEEKIRNRFNELDDMVATTGSALLGLTVACARCHDHKYDPIPTRDYYRLLAAFNSGDRAEVPLPGLGGETAFAMRDFGPEPRKSSLLDRGDFHVEKEPVELGFLTVLTGDKPADAYWAEARAAGVRKDTTYQRRAVAEWITDLDRGAGPLVARVIVNRLWQHHFGEGLVRTVNDFGVQGERPSHPELLERLAAELVRNGWRLKPIHRLIMTSETYRLSSSTESQESASPAADPENRLLRRRRPRRIESELLRDAMLAVADRLNPRLYGPSFKPFIPEEAMQARNLKSPYPTNVPETPDTLRRTVYLFHKRVIQYPLLQAFDGPDAAASCGRRNATTVAPQALAVLNDPLVRARAADFAGRLRAEAGDDRAARASHAFRLALGRGPSETELRAATTFLARSEGDPLTDFCQAVFGLNEFLYVD